MSAVRERIEAGAAYLDETLPGWWDTIDLDTLNMGSGCRCVLGQLAVDMLGAEVDDEDEIIVDYNRAAGFDGCDYLGDTPYFLWIYGELPATPPLSLDEARDLGFSQMTRYADLLDTQESTLRWDELTEGWRQFVTERRGARS